MAQSDRAYLYVLRKLAAREWPPGERTPSLRQLAKGLRMSTKPLYQAFQSAGRQGLLSVGQRFRTVVLPEADRKARELLLQLADHDGARRLAVLIPADFFPLSGAPLHAELGQAVCQAAGRQDFQAEIVPIPHEGQAEFAQDIASRFDAGVVIGPRPEKFTALFALRSLSMPLLVFNRQVAGLDATSVYLDNYGAAARLARMLVQLGHRNLCLITSTEDEFTSGWQHTLSGGWIDALRQAGVIDACTLPVIYHPRGMFYDMMDRILALRPRITALVLGYPAMVERLAAEPRFHDVQVPGRISVATLNTTRNVPRPPGWPPVTSFEMNMKRVGEVIVAHVQTMLVGVAPPPNVRLPLDIVVTDSIGHPPAD